MLGWTSKTSTTPSGPTIWATRTASRPSPGYESTRFFTATAPRPTLIAVRQILLRAVVLLGSWAIGLLVAAWVVPGVSLSVSGFIVAVVVFSVSQAILSAVDLEVAPWVCVAAPWGHRPGIDHRRVESRLGINSRAHHSRHCILGGHNGRGVARDNGRGNFTARAVGPRRRRLDLTKSRRTHVRAVYSRHRANSATASGAPRATFSNERASLSARACSMRCTHRRRWYLLARVQVRGANAGRDDDDRTSGAAVARPTVFPRRLSRWSAAKVLHFAGSAE